MAAVNIGLFLSLIVIFATGIHASHYLFQSAVKTSNVILVTHAICGSIASLFVLAHILFHTKTITKNKILSKMGLIFVLPIVIGYSFFGGVQGALHHSLPKDGEQKIQHEQRMDVSDFNYKNGTNKETSILDDLFRN